MKFAGANRTSDQQASNSPWHLAGPRVSPTRAQRPRGRVGREPLDQRRRAAKAYQDLPLSRRETAPKGVNPPEAVVVRIGGE